jgi:hypothetical protein
MRIIAVLAALAFAALAPAPVAQAQQATTVQAAPSPARLAAARELLSAVLIDTGAMSSGVNEAFTALAPQIRTDWSSRPFYAGLTPARKTALSSYFDRLGPIAVELLRGATPGVLDTITPDMATLFNEAEAREITAFFRTPEGRGMFMRGVSRGVAERANPGTPAQPVTMSEADQRASDAFNATPGGQAMMAKSAEFNALLVKAVQQGFIAITPALRSRMSKDVCGILVEQCPADIRAMGQ